MRLVTAPMQIDLGGIQITLRELGPSHTPGSLVVEILDELERRLIFIFRPGGRDVVWAYPVTAEPTPHHLDFSSGERFSACSSQAFSGRDWAVL